MFLKSKLDRISTPIRSTNIKRGDTRLKSFVVVTCKNNFYVVVTCIGNVFTGCVQVGGGIFQFKFSVYFIKFVISHPIVGFCQSFPRFCDSGFHIRITKSLSCHFWHSSPTISWLCFEKQFNLKMQFSTNLFYI